jgi:signal transduction histidine kinase
MADQKIAVSGRFRNKASHALWLLFSVPIYYKILGIGALVAVLFGTVIGYQMNKIVSERLYQELEGKALSTAILLSGRITRPLIVDDLTTGRKIIEHTMHLSSDIIYVVVENSKGGVALHSFPRAIPPDLVDVGDKSVPPAGQIINLKTDKGMVLEARFPVLQGRAGTVRVGFSYMLVVAALKNIHSSFLWTLIICLILGQILALVLAYVLTKPIHHLVVVSNALSTGNFGSRAQIFSNDEIGHLAETFNAMAKSLEKSSKELLEKEQIRLSLVRKVVTSQEEERKRVARELHDETGQSLTSLLLQVQSCDINETDSEQIEKNICNMVNDIKRIASDLRPSLLDDYGLNYALDHYIDDLEKHSHIKMDYQYMSTADSLRLNRLVEVTLYRIAQESLTNVIRHAQASRVGIVLICSAKDTTLIVEDNGIGFTEHEIQLAKGPSLGIVGMRERVSLIGGELTIESSLGQGTTIRTRIPLREIENDD